MERTKLPKASAAPRVARPQEMLSGRSNKQQDTKELDLLGELQLHVREVAHRCFHGEARAEMLQEA